MLGIWSTDRYHVSGVRPLGLYLPSSTSARASPLRMPLYELHRIAGVVGSKDVTSCGPIVSMTATVFGLAAETWLISWPCRPGRASDVRSRSSVPVVPLDAVESMPP